MPLQIDVENGGVDGLEVQDPRRTLELTHGTQDFGTMRLQAAGDVVGQEIFVFSDQDSAAREQGSVTCCTYR